MLLIIAMLSVSAFSQSYLGHTTKEVILRETAGSKAPLIKTLRADCPILIVTLKTDNDFYNVVEIETNMEGFVQKDFVKVGEQVKNNDELLKLTGESVNYNPDIDVFNSTDAMVTLKLNFQTYTINPGEHKTLSLLPGAYSYRAFAPGSIPIIGVVELKSNQRYSWDFKFESLNK